MISFKKFISTIHHFFNPVKKQEFLYKSEFEAIHKSIDNIIQIQKDFQTIITESKFLLNKLKFANSPEEKLVILKEIQELCKKNKN